MLCRCKSDGPFILDPEEVETGNFMSLQVCNLRHLIVRATSC